MPTHDQSWPRKKPPCRSQSGNWYCCGQLAFWWHPLLAAPTHFPTRKNRWFRWLFLVPTTETVPSPAAEDLPGRLSPPFCVPTFFSLAHLDAHCRQTDMSTMFCSNQRRRRRLCCCCCCCCCCCLVCWLCLLCSFMIHGATSFLVADSCVTL